MPTPLEDQLLASESGGKTRSNRRAMGLAIAALMLTAGFIGYSMGNSADAPEFEHDAILAKLAQAANSTELMVVPYSEQCYGYTGGTCVTSGCKDWRHSTCADGKCVCAHGCTGSDGVCRPGTYTKVASQFSMVNVKFYNSWLYVQRMSALSQLKVSAGMGWTFGGTQYFDMYELPGKIRGKKMYFLASNKWPNWVAAIKSTGSVLTGSISPYGLFAVNLYHTIAPWDPTGVVVQVCSLRKMGYPDAIMIGSAATSGRAEWAYVHHGSWFVYGWGALSQDPGTGGYWTPSVSISGLEDC